MIDFEKQIKDARMKENQVVNEDEFLYKLEMRLQHSKDNRKTLMVSVMILPSLTWKKTSKFEITLIP